MANYTVDGIQIGSDTYTFAGSGGASVKTIKKTVAASTGSGGWSTSSTTPDTNYGTYYVSYPLDGITGANATEKIQNLLSVRLALNTSPYETVFSDYTYDGTNLKVYSNSLVALIVVATYL